MSTPPRVSVEVIDCHYLHPQFAAVFLIIRDGSAILVENNTEHCIPYLKAELRAHQLDFSNIDYLFVTHAHLDHAGATGRLAQLAPQATICGHPKAMEHLVSPEKLVHGVVSVYGKDRFNSWYGDVSPVPRERTRPLASGEKIHWKGLEFAFIHTRGHANHHCIIFETHSKVLFTGDAFGLCYPELQNHGLFVIPTTSPTGFEPDPAIQTVELIQQMNPSTAYLTHFGALTRIHEAADQLLNDLRVSKRLVEKAGRAPLAQEDLPQFCTTRLTNHFKKRCEGIGIRWEDAHKLLSLDLELNGAGLAHAASYVRKQAFSSSGRGL